MWFHLKSQDLLRRLSEDLAELQHYHHGPKFCLKDLYGFNNDSVNKQLRQC